MIGSPDWTAPGSARTGMADRIAEALTRPGRALTLAVRAPEALRQRIYTICGSYLDQPKITCTMVPTSCPWPIPPNPGPWMEGGAGQLAPLITGAPDNWCP
jgi:hypothetical protein